jgi:hypothetical protein
MLWIKTFRATFLRGTHVTDSTCIFKAVNIMLRIRMMYNKDWVFQEVSFHVIYSY